MMNFKCFLNLPETLPPPGSHQVRSYCRFASVGLLLVLAGLFPQSAVARNGMLALLAVWLIVILRDRCRPRPARSAVTVQLWLFGILIILFGIGFTVWARQLALPWPIVLGALFLIEGLANAIASLTDWWRLSMIGHALGLMACGAAFPLVAEAQRPLILGAAILLGALSSVAILVWQQRQIGAADGRREELRAHG